MTAVFVHGVPETPAVWRGLLAALDRPDTVALSLPGFGTARPAGFGATMEEYAAWLAAQLERLGDPVDLVGHDWGGGFVVRVVSTRPELVRSWVTDAAGIARGGIRTGWVDVPVAALSGLTPPGATGIGILLGSTRVFDAAELARRYPGGPGDYVAAFREATMRAATAGFVLEQDVDEIVAVATAAYPAP